MRSALQRVPHRPAGKFAYPDILKYAQATADAARPPAAFSWLRGGRARIRANLQPDDLVSVQVAWFPGWKAAVRGESRPVSADGMGFIVIQPHCQRDCEILLAWTGPSDPRAGRRGFPGCLGVACRPGFPPPLYYFAAPCVTPASL